VKATDPAALVNTATAIGTPPTGNPVSAQAAWTVGILSAPTGLAAAPGNASVSLKWSPATGASSYNVKRSAVSGGPYATLITGLTTTNYTDTTVSNGMIYYYVVSAVRAGLESPNSAPVSALPSAGLPAPGALATSGMLPRSAAPVIPAAS